MLTPLFSNEKCERWSRHYYKLCNRALDRKPKKGVYYEQHHMLPKCQWGYNEIIVLLTPEEHYVAHQLLVKMFPEHQGLAAAAFLMGNSGTKYQKRNNKTYGWLRQRFVDSQKIKVVSDSTKMKISEALTGRSLSDETRQKMSKAKAGKPSNNNVGGWNKGIKMQPRSDATRKHASDSMKSVWAKRKLLQQKGK